MNETPLQEVASRISLPIHRGARTNKNVALLFFPDDAQDVTPNGSWELIGGISWPETVMTPAGVDVVGCALCIATHMETRCSVVLSECKFRNIDHVFGNEVGGIGSTGILERNNRGLFEWLAKIQSVVGLNSFYYSASWDVHLHWLQEIKKCDNLLLKPKLIEAVDMPEDVALSCIYSRVAQGKLRYPLSGLCWTALAENAGHAAGGSIGKAPTDPVLKALSAASRSIAAWPARVDQPSF